MLGLNLVEDMVINLKRFDPQHRSFPCLLMSVYQLYTIVKMSRPLILSFVLCDNFGLGEGGHIHARVSDITKEAIVDGQQSLFAQCVTKVNND